MQDQIPQPSLGPGQVITDVNPEEPEAADSLHRSPVDGEGGVFYTMSLPVVHEQLIRFADVVVLAQRCQGTDLFSGHLIIAGDQAYDGRVISKLVQGRTEHAGLGVPVLNQGGGVVLPI